MYAPEQTERAFVRISRSTYAEGKLKSIDDSCAEKALVIISRQKRLLGSGEVRRAAIGADENSYFASSAMPAAAIETAPSVLQCMRQSFRHSNVPIRLPNYHLRIAFCIVRLSLVSLSALVPYSGPCGTLAGRSRPPKADFRFKVRNRTIEKYLQLESSVNM